MLFRVGGNYFSIFSTNAIWVSGRREYTWKKFSVCFAPVMVGHAVSDAAYTGFCIRREQRRNLEKFDDLLCPVVCFFGGGLMTEVAVFVGNIIFHKVLVAGYPHGTEAIVGNNFPAVFLANQSAGTDAACLTDFLS